MIEAFFIAGTDTDVGKTVASVAILRALAKKGLNTVGYKPVAAGSDKTSLGFRNSDALYLKDAATVEVSYDDVNPYALELPASPHIAARNEGIDINYKVLTNKLAQHKQNSDIVLVEGAGGWRVPVSDDDCLSSWVQQQKLPVVLVVGIKLGCLSHALLTFEAIKTDGLDVVGWVANRIDPDAEYYPEMIEMLERKINAPKIGEIPYLPNPLKRELADCVNVDPLIDA